ncbi:hypothetical protein ACJJTC_005508 [Scirpophaga incertulas]
MVMNGLKQGVHCPTRLKACLDHFIVKSACMTETFVFDELTDHSPILLMFQNCNINKNNNNQSYNRRKIVNFEGVKKDLAKETWSTLYSTSDANLAAQTLTTSLQKIIKKNATINMLQKKSLPLKPWITSGIVKSIRKRDKIHKQVKKHSNNIELRQKYIKYRNLLRKLIKKLKYEYYNNQLKMNNGNIKNTWNIIKDFCNIKNNKSPSNELLKIKSNTKDSLDYINNFFTSVGPNIASTTLQKLACQENELATKSRSNQLPLNSMAVYPTNPREILDVICNLKSKCASGYDDISTSKYMRHFMITPNKTGQKKEDVLELKNGIAEVYAPLHDYPE